MTIYAVPWALTPTHGFPASLWSSGYVEDKPLVQHIQALNLARKAAAASNPSYHSTPLKFESVTAQSFAVSKPPMTALFTNRGAASSPSWIVASAGYAPGEVLVDVLSCATVAADGNGGISVQGSGGMPQVLLPAAALSKTGKVCPKVATGQASGASSVRAAGTVGWTTVGLAVVVAGVVARVSM